MQSQSLIPTFVICLYALLSGCSCPLLNKIMPMGLSGIRDLYVSGRVIYWLKFIRDLMDRIVIYLFFILFIYLFYTSIYIFVYIVFV